MKNIIIILLLGCGQLCSQTIVHEMFEADNSEAFNKIEREASKVGDLERFRAMIFVIHHVIKDHKSAELTESIRVSSALEIIKGIPDKIEFSKADLDLLVDAIEWFLVNEGSVDANAILRSKLNIGPSDKDFVAME